MMAVSVLFSCHQRKFAASKGNDRQDVVSIVGAVAMSVFPGVFVRIQHLCMYFC